MIGKKSGIGLKAYAWMRGKREERRKEKGRNCKSNRNMLFFQSKKCNMNIIMPKKEDK